MRIIAQNTLWMSAAALTLVAAGVATAPAQEIRRGTPPPEVISLTKSIIQAINEGGAAVDALAKEHFTGDYAGKHTANERQAWFDSIRAKHGTLTVTQLQRSSPDEFTIVATGQHGTLDIVVTHDPQLKVVNLRVDHSAGQ